MGKDTITFKFSREALHTDGARIVGNAFYDLAATLFEWGGERNLDENGKPACDVHGHHTAQRISEYAVSLWEGRPHPLQADLSRVSAEIAGLRAYLTRSIANDLDGMDEAFEILGNVSAQDREMVDAWVKEMSDPAYWSKEVAELRAEALALLAALDAHEDVAELEDREAYHAEHQDAVYDAKTALRNVLIGKESPK